MKIYWCPKCEKEAETVNGLFIHPHIGKTPCKRCAKCNTMVYIKEEK